MSSKITVVLWQSSDRTDFQLFGRPLWHLGLAAARKLRPQRILLVSMSEEDIGDINDVEVVDADRGGGPRSPQGRRSSEPVDRRKIHEVMGYRDGKPSPADHPPRPRPRRR